MADAAGLSLLESGRLRSGECESLQPGRIGAHRIAGGHVGAVDHVAEIRGPEIGGDGDRVSAEADGGDRRSRQRDRLAHCDTFQRRGDGAARGPQRDCGGRRGRAESELRVGAGQRAQLHFAALVGIIDLAGIGGGQDIRDRARANRLHLAGGGPGKAVDGEQRRAIAWYRGGVDLTKCRAERECADLQRAGDGEKALGQCQTVEIEIGNVVIAVGIARDALIEHHGIAVDRNAVGPVRRIAPGIAGETADSAGLSLLESGSWHCRCSRRLSLI